MDIIFSAFLYLSLSFLLSQTIWILWLRFFQRAIKKNSSSFLNNCKLIKQLSTTARSLFHSLALSPDDEEEERLLNVCCILNLDNMAALMTDGFSLLTGRGVSGWIRTDENWAKHDSKIKRMVPEPDSDPFVFPKEPFIRIGSVMSVTTPIVFKDGVSSICSLLLVSTTFELSPSSWDQCNQKLIVACSRSACTCTASCAGILHLF